ncbi:Lrat-like domain, partial [Globisporangium splendens]
MNTCAVKVVASLQPADHICIWDKTRWPFRYTHHGIVFQTGKTQDDIVIAHVWSRIDGFRESQADSSFRLTSLTEFLNGRPISDMRRVQYNSSLVGNALSKLGEVHRARSDIPPIVLARCNFLLGLGKGHFSILSLNCEHVALWCKTGVVWSKQLFHKVNTKAPFFPSNCPDLLLDLDLTVERLHKENEARIQEIAALHGKRVYLQLGATKFVKRLGDSLYAIHNDPKETDLAFRHNPTPFIAHVEVLALNCVNVSLEDAETSEYMCSKAKRVILATKRSYHRESMFKFEYAWNGELQSRRHRRWYIGAQTRDGLLRTFNTRDKASTFQIVDAEVIDSVSVDIDSVVDAVLAAAGATATDDPAAPTSGEAKAGAAQLTLQPTTVVVTSPDLAAASATKVA